MRWVRRACEAHNQGVLAAATVMRTEGQGGAARAAELLPIGTPRGLVARVVSAPVRCTHQRAAFSANPWRSAAASAAAAFWYGVSGSGQELHRIRRVPAASIRAIGVQCGAEAPVSGRARDQKNADRGT